MPLRKWDGPRVPENYPCANPACGRRVTVRTYQMGGYPTDDTDPATVHRIYNPNVPEFAVFCTCGHRKIVSPRPQQDVTA